MAGIFKRAKRYKDIECDGLGDGMKSMMMMCVCEAGELSAMQDADARIR
jgi:hypothetical protein